MIQPQRGMVYLVDDAYWLCTNDDPHDIQWEKLEVKKPQISTSNIYIPLDITPEKS